VKCGFVICGFALHIILGKHTIFNISLNLSLKG